MRVAIVCSWLNQYGGAERVLEAVHAMYPEAPVYTSLFYPGALPAAYRDWDVRTSFLNRLPLVRRHHQWLLPFYPYAFEQFDFADYDLVLSVTSAFAHGIVTHPKTLHICYCLTPARFLWDYHTYVAREGFGRLVRCFLPLFLRNLRLWDRVAADRVDHFLAISKAVQQRVHKHYGRDAEIIYPPVNVERFQLCRQRGDYFLIISRLVPYKRVDLAVKAFSQLGLPLWIVGDGRDRRALEAMAAPNVRFLGRASDEDIERYLGECRAFVFPGEEDFGIAPLEAQAAGRPVIAYAAGGALETVVEGRTGLFFREQTPEALAEVMACFRDDDFDPQAIRKHAVRFGRKGFERRFGEFVVARCGEFSASQGST
ncbi:MAG TPA: glycosyltransferase [Anaerolineae bacterium]|nr:glycosyltransferase [Anaerolineae bacterium]